MYLLLLSCSQKKKNIVKARAIDLYDGPYYQIIRKLKKSDLMPKNIEIYILSAKYGIIHENTIISNYDQKMTISRAKELNKKNIEDIQHILNSNRYKTFIINLGKLYMESIKGYEKILPPHTNVEIIEGEIGQRISRLKKRLLLIKSEEKTT